MPIYCKKCYDGYVVTRIKLIQSGKPDPYSWICPVCKEYYADSGKLSEDHIEQEKLAKEKLAKEKREKEKHEKEKCAEDTNDWFKKYNING